MATTNPIDEYLASLDEPKRATLTSLRDTIMAIVPEAEQCISYGMPAFKLKGKTIAGFAAFKDLYRFKIRRAILTCGFMEQFTRPGGTR